MKTMRERKRRKITTRMTVMLTEREYTHCYVAQLESDIESDDREESDERTPSNILTCRHYYYCCY